MNEIIIALLVAIAIVATLIFLELIKIRAAIGAFAVLRQHGTPRFQEEVTPAAKKSLFSLSLKSPRCD